MSNDSARKNLEHELNLAVQRWGNLNVLFTHAIAGHVGLSATEFEALSLLKDNGPMPAGKLAQLSGLTTGAITGLVDRLEKVGMVERRADPKDRRRVMIGMGHKPEIGAKIRELYRPVGEAFTTNVGRYSDTELAVILDFINQSVSDVEKIATDLYGQKLAK